MHVDVVTVGGVEVASVDIGSYMVVRELHHRIAEVASVSPSRVRLLHGAVNLAASYLLASYLSLSLAYRFVPWPVHHVDLPKALGPCETRISATISLTWNW